VIRKKEVCYRGKKTDRYVFVAQGEEAKRDIAVPGGGVYKSLGGRGSIVPKKTRVSNAGFKGKP